MQPSSVLPFSERYAERMRSGVLAFCLPYRAERSTHNALGVQNAADRSVISGRPETGISPPEFAAACGPAVYVLSCDPSLTGCAFATSDGIDLHETELTSRPASGVAGTLARFRALAAPIVAQAVAKRPTLFVIEGQSFGSQGGAAFDRAGFRWVLYDRIAPHVGQILEVAPTALKKHACGKGTADKAAVISALANRYGRSFASDNAADAFALLQIGLQLLGLREPVNQAQRDVLATLRKAGA